MPCICQQLYSAPLLEGLPPDLVEGIAAKARLQTLSGRHERLVADDLSRRFFFVATGEIRLIQTTPDGQEMLVRRLKSGEFFCLSALVAQKTCHSYAANVGRTDLLYWKGSEFRRLIDDNPAFSQNILTQMAHQLDRERELHTLARCNRADTKVAAYLLHRFHNTQGSETLPTIDLRPLGLTAQELGIARETLSRCLQRLHKRGAIHYRRGHVSPHDDLALEGLRAEVDCLCHCS
jgi:CRP-like cAMP-binding protein